MKTAASRLALVAALSCLAGCSVERHVAGPLPFQAPSPDSPSNVIRLFEWGWNHMQVEPFRQILAADFQFVFASGDSAGNAFRADPIGRDTLLVILHHLFVGGGAQPPAHSIVLALDPTLVALPDVRPGRNPRWHKEIATGVNLDIKTKDQQEYRIIGWSRFYVVRGDSALIPADLAAEGVVADSTRWYMDRWEDGTLGNGGALHAAPSRPQPANSTSWGRILALYLR